MSRMCINHPDNFCYVCGEHTIKSNRQKITPLIGKAYELYFDLKLGDENRSWAPHVVCRNCASRLRGWLKNKRKVSMPFAIPMVWREPMNHIDDCYFCMTKITGLKGKDKKTIEYPNIPSAIRPVAHSDEIPIPVPPKSFKTSWQCFQTSTTTSTTTTTSTLLEDGYVAEAVDTHPGTSTFVEMPTVVTKSKKRQHTVAPEKKEVQEHELLQFMKQNFKPTDEYSAFGELVGHKIRKLRTERLRSIAQNRINNILFELEMSEENNQCLPPNTTLTSLSVLTPEQHQSAMPSTSLPFQPVCH